MKTKPAVNTALRSALALAAVAAVVGCSSSNLVGHDGEGIGGVSGATGLGGAGAGGSVGTGSGGAGNGSGVTCPVGERTPDITDCTEFANTAASVLSERAEFDGDAGIYLPGGALVTPAGGTLVDGDYELVRAVWGTTSQHTQRTIRLFASGTYTEWEVDQDSTQPEADGGVMHFRINASWTISGSTLTITSVGCGNLSGPYGYTASGDELHLFNFSADGYFVYKRVCTRR
jgi:hypothetical protein